MSAEIVVVGGGVVGLSMALAIQKLGVKVILLERQKATSLAQPEDDGREIALTRSTQQLLCDLGIWRQIRARYFSPVRQLEVRVAPASISLPVPMLVDPIVGLVSHHELRRAAYGAVCNVDSSVQICDAQTPARVDVSNACVEIAMENGSSVRCKLAIGADGRQSSFARMAGFILARKNFEDSIMLCRVSHPLPHEERSIQWFKPRLIVANLPLKRASDREPWSSSMAIYGRTPAIDALDSLPDSKLSEQLSKMTNFHFGSMQVEGHRCQFPLSTSVARRFSSTRCALIGDAALGLHPATGQGFNFGMAGVARLAREIARNLDEYGDVGHHSGLARYDRSRRLLSAGFLRGSNQLIKTMQEIAASSACFTTRFSGVIPGIT
ncbi:hypothetical protein WM40_25570 [Robbsia andropogonis]|uniref:FAD-binding domain-containing protein n=1 Tax=Robbsia andropogonis TaxID=28092 RepID=A0A0F5JT80_9BURK|nr:FAD-dependent oxidoreductase [Robbsia andropogonis]KKB61036.1 hypothetical protein WM40_25570 [Robbsia andropogonis]